MMLQQEFTTDDANQLRRQTVEKIEKMAEIPEALSPDQVREIFHELQLRQIELEMQNEELRQVQAEKDAARSQYFEFYNLAPVGFCSISQQGLIIECNLTTATLLGADRSDLIDQPFTRFIHREDQDIYYLNCKQLSAPGLTQTCDLRMARLDGTVFWVQLAATAVMDSRGMTAYSVVLSDITASKLQAQRSELTAQLITLINTPGDFRKHISELTASLHDWSGCEAVGIRLRDGDDYPYFETRGFSSTFVQAETHLCAYGPDGQVLRDGIGNPVLECMCGNILCGRFDPVKPFFTKHGSFWTNSTTALLASTTEADRQARTRNRCNGVGYESVALIPLRDGDQVFGLLQFNDHRLNRFSPDMIAQFERMADSLAIALSRHQAVAEMLASKATLDAALASMTDAVFISDAEGRLINFNDAFATFHKYGNKDECSKALAEYSRAMDIFTADGKPAPMEQWTIPRALRGETGTNVEYRLRRKDTGETWVGSYSFAPILNREGTIVGAVGTGRDITHEKQMEAERIELEYRLQQAKKAESLGRMAGAIAHHFNNQLYVVIGNLELVLNDLPLGSENSERLIDAMKASHKAADVSRLMLTYLGQTPGNPEQQDLSETCHKGLLMVQTFIPKNVTIEPVFPFPGPTIYANKSQIHQVLSNLITNAAESFSKSQGTITISVKTVPSVNIPGLHRFPVEWHPQHTLYACLEVADTGCGIATEDIEKIFDPFFTTKFTGRGLGLSVVLGIVGAHGGGITVKSHPGRGSIVRVYLPVSVETVPVLEPKKRKIEDFAGCGTVLLVEDETQVRTMARTMLSRLGYTVLEAKDGVEAVEIFQQHRDEIRCVLSDLTMPRMNGWETLAALRNISPKIPVILSSGYDESQVMTEEHSERPNAFLGKPYQLKGLRETISRVLFPS